MHQLVKQDCDKFKSLLKHIHEKQTRMRWACDPLTIVIGKRGQRRMHRRRRKSRTPTCASETSNPRPIVAQHVGLDKYKTASVTIDSTSRRSSLFVGLRIPCIGFFLRTSHLHVRHHVAMHPSMGQGVHLVEVFQRNPSSTDANRFHAHRVRDVAWTRDPMQEGMQKGGRR